MSEPIEKLNKSSKGGAREGAGRPKSEATIRTQEARDYISQQMKDNLAPIVNKAITQAIEGSHEARTWLADRAWGKPVQPNVLEDTEGNPLIIQVPAAFAQAFNITNALPNTEAGDIPTQ